MWTYLTEITIWDKVYSWPNIEADSYEHADEIELKEYKWTYQVVGELEMEFELN